MSVSAPVAPENPRRRHWWLAAFLSLLLPGLGQLYAGRGWRAVAFLLVNALIDFPFLLGLWSFATLLQQPNGFWLAAAAGIGSVLFRLVAIVDAALVARRATVRSLAFYQRWYLYVALLFMWNAPALAGMSYPAPGTESYSIPSGSMQPTLQVGDHVIGIRLSAADGPPPRGTIVTHVDATTGDIYIRRLIGLPGDTVEMRGGRLILNGVPIPTEPAGTYRSSTGAEIDMLRETLPDGASYLVLDKGPNGPLDDMPPLTVPAGSVFLLGDNRDNARDDRVHGPTLIRMLEAEIRYVYWSRDLARIGESLD